MAATNDSAGTAGNRSYNKAFLIDMDGVMTRGRTLIPGSTDFVNRLKSADHKFLFLTNNSYYTPHQLNRNLCNLGIDVGDDHFYTLHMSLEGKASWMSWRKPA